MDWMFTSCCCIQGTRDHPCSEELLGCVGDSKMAAWVQVVLYTPGHTVGSQHEEQKETHSKGSTERDL